MLFDKFNDVAKLPSAWGLVWLCVKFVLQACTLCFDGIILYWMLRHPHKLLIIWQWMWS